MAEKAIKKLDEQLNCSICFDTYTDPKLLQCFHICGRVGPGPRLEVYTFVYKPAVTLDVDTAMIMIIISH